MIEFELVTRLPLDTTYRGVIQCATNHCAWCQTTSGSGRSDMRPLIAAFTAFVLVAGAAVVVGAEPLDPVRNVALPCEAVSTPGRARTAQ